MNPFKYIAVFILGGVIVWGLSTHGVGDTAVNVCDTVHKYSHNFLFELAIVLIIALLIWGIIALFLTSVPVAFVLIGLIICVAIFSDDSINKSDVHISDNHHREEVYGG